MKAINRFPKYSRWRTNDTLPGQTLKRKKWIFVSIVLICAACDVFLLFILGRAISPLSDAAPYLPEKYAQAYTHLATFRKDPGAKHREAINAISFSPDGQTLATGGSREVYLWNINTGKPVSLSKRHPGPINAVTFSPDGKTLASVSRDSKRSSTHPTILWDPAARSQKIAHHHMAPYTVRLWDTKTGISRLTAAISISPLTALAFSPDGTKLLIASQNGVIDVYDSTTGHRELERLGLFAHDRMLNRIGTIAFAAAPDDKIMTCWGWKTDGFTPNQLSEIETARRFLTVQWFTNFRFVGEPSIGLNTGKNQPLSFLIPDTYRIRALAFSPNNKIIASGGKDREFRLYDTADGKIQLWDANTGHLLHTFNSPGGPVRSLVFSPDSKTLASIGKDWWNKIFIWDLENYRLLSIVTTGNRAIKALQFAPDSITLASAHSDGTVHLWDITGRIKK